MEPGHGRHAAATEPKLPAEVKTATGAVFWPQLPGGFADVRNLGTDKPEVENPRGLGAEARVDAPGPPLRSGLFCSSRTLS